MLLLAFNISCIYAEALKDVVPHKILACRTWSGYFTWIQFRSLAHLEWASM